MTTIFNTQRFGALFSVATSLLLVSGCRSASVNSTSDPNSVYVPNAPQPFFRSFERAPRPYDDNYQTPPPEPPDILPVPGTSDPAVPPAPSTQKQKRSWLPASVKFKPTSPPNSRVNQTGTSGSGQGASASLGDAQSIPLAPPNPSNDLSNEAVPLRLSAPSAGVQLSSPVPVGDRNTDRLSDSDSVVADAGSIRNPTITSSKARDRIRYGTITPWPYAQNSAPRLNSTGTGGSNSNASLGQPQSVPDLSSSVGEIPLLLPPTP